MPEPASAPPVSIAPAMPISPPKPAPAVPLGSDSPAAPLTALAPPVVADAPARPALAPPRPADTPFPSSEALYTLQCNETKSESEAAHHFAVRHRAGCVTSISMGSESVQTTAVSKALRAPLLFGVCATRAVTPPTAPMPLNAPRRAHANDGERWNYPNRAPHLRSPSSPCPLVASPGLSVSSTRPNLR